MPLRSWVKRLERRSKKRLASFELVDGSTYYYDPLEAYASFILFCYRLGSGGEPEVPEVYRRLEKAANIPSVLDGLRPDRPDLAPHSLEGVFDIDHLLAHRELVVRAEALEPAVDLSE
jgi:hypothetical protein